MSLYLPLPPCVTLRRQEALKWRSKFLFSSLFALPLMVLAMSTMSGPIKQRVESVTVINSLPASWVVQLLLAAPVQVSKAAVTIGSRDFKEEEEILHMMYRTSLLPYSSTSVCLSACFASRLDLFFVLAPSSERVCPSLFLISFVFCPQGRCNEGKRTVALPHRDIQAVGDHRHTLLCMCVHSCVV